MYDVKIYRGTNGCSDQAFDNDVQDLVMRSMIMDCPAICMRALAVLSVSFLLCSKQSQCKLITHEQLLIDPSAARCPSYSMICKDHVIQYALFLAKQ